MMASKPSSAALIKGQFRCFECKKPCLLKEGNWCTRGNQQVFLCWGCQMTGRGAAERFSSSARRLTAAL